MDGVLTPPVIHVCVREREQGKTRLLYFQKVGWNNDAFVPSTTCTERIKYFPPSKQPYH